MIVPVCSHQLVSRAEQEAVFSALQISPLHDNTDSISQGSSKSNKDTLGRRKDKTCLKRGEYAYLCLQDCVMMVAVNLWLQ